MQTFNARVITIAPLQIPFALKTGVDTDSIHYRNLLSDIADLDPAIQISGRNDSEQYQNLKEDDDDACLFRWQVEDKDGTLRFNVFQNQIAIVDTVLPEHLADSVSELENTAKQQTRRLIERHWPRFVELLQTIQHRVKNPLLLRAGDMETTTDEPQIHWISRTLLVAPAERAQPQVQSLMSEWLAETQYPQHAAEIARGERDYSMTWLNYVLVEQQHDYHIDTMILAQYYYTAQENCLKQLKQAISATYIDGQLQTAEKQLSKSRVTTRLHLIDYHEQLKFLTRPKRRLLLEILESWEFGNLVENSQRMIDVCSSRLEEADHQRRERSTVMTDLLLVTLSFFAVFELSLYLVEFSREMMSRPALDYNDESSSLFLGLIAGIDTDIMFGFGFLLTLGLVLIYKRIKSH
ncbi:MAG: hypothetical protein AAFN68_00510 [Pseudomonadota bacterium]